MNSLMTRLPIAAPLVVVLWLSRRRRRRKLSGEVSATEQTLARARAGDQDAFRELTDPYRRELQLHAYRIVGSAQDAEDLLQETLLAAWRDLDGFGGRASLRAWLYGIATHRALDALRARRRRPEELQPFPDALLEGVPDDAPGPAARYETREATALAFVAGLQHLAPRQRAALVLRDVLGFRAAEVARMLGASETSVNSLLRRARAALASRTPSDGNPRAPLPGSRREREIAGRFADAVEAGDVDGMVALLTGDARLTMPPEPGEYRGRDAIGAFLREREALRGVRLRLVATRANGQPAFGCYLPERAGGVAHPHALFVLTLRDDGISAITWFGGAGAFARFALPPAR
jgi:RNA polymerase sigma-70 factor (ECF subfamily)